jgi:hypothetical protein
MVFTLTEFLAAHELPHLEQALAGVTLKSLLEILFTSTALGPLDSRPALLSYLSDHGIKLKDRQALANALNHASREGTPGVAETDDEVRQRTAWLELERPSFVDKPEVEVWPPSCHSFLVFTSAGDASNVCAWLKSPSGATVRDFELLVTYYGDESEPACLHAADRSMRRRGGKFPNLACAVLEQPLYMRGFEAILVADDDLRIDADSISSLFHLRRAHDLWLLQPANATHVGKADIPETRAELGVSHRLVNFCEVTAPLFRTDKLFSFLREYIPRRHEPRMLVGYGIDLWFCQHLLCIDTSDGSCVHADKAAIVDSITFINPEDREKPRGREIDRLQSSSDRLQAWTTLCEMRGMACVFPKHTFKRFTHAHRDV